jgi:hypothetical protein
MLGENFDLHGDEAISWIEPRPKFAERRPSSVFERTTIPANDDTLEPTPRNRGWWERWAIAAIVGLSILNGLRVAFAVAS